MTYVVNLNPPTIEERVHEVIDELRSHATAGTLTREILASGIVVIQDWLTYLETLEVGELEIPDIGTAFDEDSEIITITEGKT